MGAVVPSFHRMSGSRHRVRRGVLVSIAAVLLLTPVIATPTAAGARRAPGDPTVISSWTLLAEKTLLADTTRKPQEAFLYLSFVDAAMYDAVVGIDGRYRPYSLHARPARGASDQAAAVAAAHRVLTEYEPYAMAALNAARDASLALIPDSQAKTDGIAYGILAAEHLIAKRVNDGRNGPALFTQAAGPGVWRPTLPALSPMSVPWMGAVTPMAIRSGAQFGEPGPPPSMTSRRYTRDFNEVKAYGSATSTVRTVAQTDMAKFFSGNATVQFTAALVDQMTVRNLDIVDTARMFAAVEMSMAEAVIAVWHAKLMYGFWRPINGHQPGQHGRQPQYHRGCDLGAAARHPTLPRICQRLLRRRGRVHPCAGKGVGNPAPESHPDLHRRSWRHPPLQLRQSPEQGGDQREGLAGNPLPLRGHRRREDGPAGRNLGAQPLLPSPRRRLRLSSNALRRTDRDDGRPPSGAARRLLGRNVARQYGRRLQREHIEGPHPITLAGEPQAAEILRYDEAAHGLIRRLVDEDLARAGRGLEARRDVHRVTDDRVMHATLRADVSSDDLSAGDPDSRLQSHPWHRRDLEAHHLYLHGERGTDGALRIVGVHHRGPEEGEDAVAEQVCDGAAMTLDGVTDDRQVAIEEVKRLLGRVLGGQRGVTPHIREQGADMSSIATERHREGVSQRFGRDALAHVPSEEIREPVLQRLRPEE